MEQSPYAGKPAEPAMLVDVPALVSAYYTERPDPADPAQRVSFGTSGHRGSSLSRAFNEAHILAVAQAVCEFRAQAGTSGPLFLGVDTHGLSEPARRSLLEVLVANDVTVLVERDTPYTPTPVVSHAILTHNRDRGDGPVADGVVVSPSHNPPEDGGVKYNPPTGGPADSATTGWIQDRANALLEQDLRGVRRVSYEQARDAVVEHDFLGRYVDDLASVVDLDAVRSAGVRIGVDPLGGAAVGYWSRIAESYGLDLTVVNDAVDPTFRFMTVDRDGKIRMDCSSPYAMAGLIEHAGKFDLALGNDTDADRHGIVTPGAGLLNPNHYLSVLASYLFGARPDWPSSAGVGKTVVTTALIDRIAADQGRPVTEVPVGFKWFVDGLLDGSLGFCGEESAGGSVLRRDGSVWTTDKDGLVLCLLAAELTARTGRDPGEHYEDLTGRFGAPVFTRIDAPATPEQKKALAALTPDRLGTGELAGDPVEQTLTEAPGGGAIGGLKVVTARGWFAARPSGTEDVYKVYAESFAGEEHLQQLVEEAQQLVSKALG